MTMTASTVTSVPIQSETVIFAIELNAPIEERDVDEPTTVTSAITPGRVESLPDVARSTGEADVAGRDLQRPAEHELPDEQEAHQPPEAARARTPRAGSGTIRRTRASPRPARSTPFRRR